MAQKYDVIVIGAGLGGLAAAALLANQGMGVLLLEKHNIPGGYATSFVRGRFEFEVALHQLSGIGPPEQRGSLHRLLGHMGVADKVEFATLPHLYRSVIGDFGLTLPMGVEPCTETLCQAFPSEAKGINRFLQRVWDLGRDFGRVIRQRGVGNPLTAPFRYPHFMRYLPVTWGRVLNRDVKDPLARAVISQYWGYFGLPPSKVSFLYMATGLASYVKYGPAFPQGRSQALSSAFVRSIEDNGGEVRLNCAAQKITTSAGRVTGVLSERGEELAADWVISNADLLTTCRRLLGDQVVPPSFFTQLRSSELAASTLNVYMGLDAPPSELGLDEHEVFIQPDPDFDRHYQSMYNLDSPAALVLTNYNLAYPAISPPGTSMVVLTSLKYGQPWLQLPPADYLATKNRLAQAMLAAAAKLYPGLQEHCEVVEVSTPVTNMRYAGALGGSIYGFGQPPRDNMVWRLGNRGPVDGLYFAGAWTRPGGGFEAVISSGAMAAGAVLAKTQKARKAA